MKNTVTFRDAMIYCGAAAAELKKRMSMLEQEQGDAAELSKLWRADSRELALLRLIHIALTRQAEADEREGRLTTLPY